MKNLLTEEKDNCLLLTVNRPDKLNALSLDTLSELKSVFESIPERKEVRGVILTGSGEKAFVAGADISEFQDLTEINARNFSESGQEIFQMIESCPIPVIAVVSGFALGGGCELAMACHMRIATESARFGQPEVNLGILPGYGGTQRLPLLIGKGRAIEFTLSADMINSEKALEWGLVNYVYSDKNAAIEAAFDLLKKIGTKAPIAVELSIQAINAATDPSADGYTVEANAFAKCCGTDDFKEGAQAFLEKRKANFKGS